MKRKNIAAAVLAVGFIVLLFNGGSRFTMGLMLKPMAEDLDWSRTSLSLAVTLFMVVSALALPIVGRLVDRFNALAILFCALLLSAICVALMSRVTTPMEVALYYGVGFALASAGTSLTPIGVLITRWFPERVGLAYSITISGMGVGQLVVILILTNQLAAIGWRGSFLLLAAMALVLLVPLLLIALLKETHNRHTTETTATHVGNQAVSNNLFSSKLWLLLLLYAVCGFQDFFVATHVVAFASDSGVDALLAGNLYAFMGLAGLAGVLVTGHLSDRLGPIWPTAICFVIRIVIFLMILFSNSLFAIAAFTLLYGSTFWITAPLTVVYTRRFFGDKNLGALTGVVTMVHHGAGGLGALAGGLAFDLDGDYRMVFMMMLVLSMLALALTYGLSRSSIKELPVS
ncbi:MAG: putative MFS-type transporter YbfB [marine bacterium B5-7]|nr:MAG: putative MFS-type transporter YbfB [marine bacterium B5-7]